MAGVDGTKISNLKDAELSETSTEAVSGKQLHATNQKVANIDKDIADIKVGDANSVKYNADKSEVVLAGADGTKISNLKDAELSETSTDAVTGKQLNDTNQKVAKNTEDIHALDDRVTKNETDNNTAPFTNKPSSKLSDCWCNGFNLSLCYFK